ncbi:hypothetical protein [Bacillus massilinigeriensis]|nr:hypothetical protein [Bacillus massilionigeriensis]
MLFYCEVMLKHTVGKDAMNIKEKREHLVASFFPNIIDKEMVFRYI